MPFVFSDLAAGQVEDTRTALHINTAALGRAGIADNLAAVHIEFATITNVDAAAILCLAVGDFAAVHIEYATVHTHCAAILGCRFIVCNRIADCSAKQGKSAATYAHRIDLPSSACAAIAQVQDSTGGTAHCNRGSAVVAGVSNAMSIQAEIDCTADIDVEV